jgi:hypothetical protein
MLTLAIHKRKEVIRCLMVQQWGRFSSFGGLASDLRRYVRGVFPPKQRADLKIPEASWFPGLELSGR